MCFAAALPLASAAMGAASQIASFQTKSAEADAANAAWQRNQVAALAADRDTQNAITTRQMQEAGVLSQHLRSINIDDARRQAEAEVSGASAGVGGIALDNIVNDIGRRSEDNRVTLMTNWDNTVAQRQQEKEAANATYLNRVNSQPSATKPSFLPTALGIAGSGLKFFGDMDKQEAATLKA